MDTFYPIHDYGPLMKGMVIGGMGIFHVFLAQFAIGGGMLLCFFEWLAQRGHLPQARHFIHSYFRLLVLISFVLGALTGVGMWFTSIQVSPQTIGLMIDEFHWIWAIEWTFFSLEIAAGYAFYRAGERLPDRARLRLLGLYTVGGWFSLFWINGILSWQLTPGGWLEGGGAWAGFFNPSFWPSLVFRTMVCMTLAALVAILVINQMSAPEEDRRALSRAASWLLAPMGVMPLVGLWFLVVMPEDSRGWALGGSVAMTNFLMIAVGASTLLGFFAVVGIWRQQVVVNTPTVALLLALAMGATAGGEFVREGVRKPYTVRDALYSNAIRPEAVARLRAEGSVTRDPWPLRDEASYPNDQLKLGAKVYRMQCAVCHTMEGVNGVMHLAGTWDARQRRLNLARLQHTKAFMPPFAGDAAELEALVQLIGWTEAGRPPAWPLSQDPALYRELKVLLDEAGTDARRPTPRPAAPLSRR